MKITYYELSHYSAGNLIRKTFDVSECDANEHRAEIDAWLSTLIGNCEEIIVCDSDDIPDRFVTEHALLPAFFEWREIVDSSHLDIEVFEAGAALDIPADEIEDAYCGHFQTDEGFAQDHAANICLMDGWPKDAIIYFDWDAYTRDLMLQGYSSHNCHYFNDNA